MIFPGKIRTCDLRCTKTLRSYSLSTRTQRIISNTESGALKYRVMCHPFDFNSINSLVKGFNACQLSTDYFASVM